MAGLFDSFPDEAPGGSTAPASGGGLFDSFPDAERATSASPATPEGVPTLRPGTDRAAAPPAPTPLPGPKAGWYTGPRGIGKVYTDPSSASSIIARAGGEGLASGIQDIANIVHPFSDTNAPRPLNPEDPLAKTLAEPLSQGWKDPKWWAAQLAHGAGYMMPAIGAAALAPEGALPQGLAFGITNMAQTLAPAYTRARQAGETPEQAADTAWKSAGVAGAFGVAMGMVPAATVFGRLVESQAKQALIRIGEQTFIAQPALGAGQQAATNLVEGRPTGEGVPEAAVMTAAQGAVLGARHAAQAGAAALAEGRQPAAAPSPPGGGTGGGPDGGTGAGAPPPAAPPPTAPPPGGAATTADLLRQVRPEQPAPVAQTPPAEPPAAAAAEPPSRVAPVSVAAAGEAQQQTAAELAQARQTPGQEDRAKVLEQEQRVLQGAAAPLPGEKQAKGKGKGQPRVAPPVPESPAEPQATSPASAPPAAPVAALAPEPKPEPPPPPADEAPPVREPEPPPPPIETGPPEDLFKNVPPERPAAPQVETPAAAEAPPPEQAPAPQEPGPAAGLALADMVRQHMAGDQPLTPRALQEMAERAYGAKLSEGKFDRKDLYDALELGVNLHVLDNPDRFDPRVDAGRAKEIAAELRALVDRMPTQTVRSQEQTRYQQFSTPPDYAYAIAWAADIRPTDRVMEPSAGTGSIAVEAANARPAQMILNELSPRRAELLAAVRRSSRERIFTEDASQLHNILPEEVRPTVVVMNPPFSQTAGRMGDAKDVMVGAQHIEQALKRLAPGGRLVAIVGQGMGPETPKFRPWFKKIAENYTTRANVLVSGKVYGKYGTNFGTRVLVIDKVPSSTPPSELVRGSVDSISALIDKLQEVRGSRAAVAAESQAGEQRPAEPAGRPVAEEGQGVEPGRGGEPAGAGRVGAPEASAGAGPGPGGAEAVPPAGAGPDAGLAAGKLDEVAAQQPRGRRRPRGAEAKPVEPAPAGGQPGGGGGPGAGGDRGPAEGGEQPLPAGGERGVKPIEVAGESASTAAEHEAADMGEVYEPYRPQRLKVAGAQEHPGKLVQSAAMASVEPPQPSYKPRLPADLVKSGGLSLPQLESVVYAGQAHDRMLPANRGEPERRRGFFIGDGTGVGKGREVAGIILDNWNQGRRKAVWVSEKQTLLEDAKRDWSGLGQDPNHIFLLNKTRPGDAIKANQGILFTTYDTMKQGMSDQQKLAQGAFIKGQRVAATTSAGVMEGTIVSGTPVGPKSMPSWKVKLDDGSMETVPKARLTPLGESKAESRVDQIVKWVGPDFDGVIAFDEAHNMANAVETKGKRGKREAAAKAIAGLELQKKLPKARVVYVSATGATEVENLAYADRLGLWGKGTPFASRDDFVSKISQGGIAAMELVARDMKALGSYIARGLSYEGVEYSRLEHKLTAEQREIYDDLATAWQHVLQNMHKALEETGGDKNARAKSAALSAFWGAHQRFFNQIITAMQMPSVLRSVEADLKEGRQAVLQLVNTNEASQERAAAKAESPEELEDLDITPRDQLIQLVEKSFPTQQYQEVLDDNGNIVSVPVVDREGRPVENKEAVAMRDAIVEKLASIRVPQGPLDMLLDHFGAENVAEVTGRKRRFVMRHDEASNRMKRMEDVRAGNANLAESEAFQSGKKRILVFSEAGGTGRSYHADNASPSAGARRAHYLVQAGWRADKAIQGFGRTHRTNQASAPVFRLVTTDLSGQKRFISSIARRLAQLGALTKGQRQTGDQGVFSARDNLESTEARDALRNFYSDLRTGQIEGLDLDAFEKQTGLSIRDSENEPEITQFLNRLLSLNIKTQNKVFDAFEERLQHVIDMKAAAGTLDVGLETVRADHAHKVSEQTVHTDPESGAETKYVKVKLQHKMRPLAFDAMQGRSPLFYVEGKRGKIYGVTAGGNRTDENGTVHSTYRLQAPDDYHYVEQHKIDGHGARDHWTRIDDPEKARPKWEAAIAKLPEYAERDLHLITGAVLPIWDRLSGNPRIMRVQTDAGERLLGRVLPENAVAPTLKALGAHAEAGAHKPEDLVAAVLDRGATVNLANGWRIERRTVAGEPRMEVIGPQTYSEGQALVKEGAYSERINFKSRYFIPTGEDAEKVMAEVTRYRPVTEVSGGGGPSFARRTGEEGQAAAAPQAEPGAGLAETLRERLDQYGLEDIQLAFARRILDGQAHGQYDRKLITLALDLPGHETRALDHEAIHALRDLGLFTDGEWQALVRAARVAEAPSGRPGETIGRLVARIYKGASPEQADEEAVATFHSYWRDGLYEPKGLAGRALQKVADFFERIGNWLRGAGFRSADDVLKAVGRGEIGARRRPNEMVGPGMVSAAQATPKGSGALRPAAEARSTVSATASGGNDMLSYARREPDTRRFGIPPEAGAPISSYPHAGRLKMHPAFAAAKAGDLAAAVRLVSDLVSPKMAEEVRRRFGPDDLFVPVIAEEASGRNAIPRQLAEHLAAIAGAHTATGIVQTTRSYHTGAGAMERLISRPRFAGPVQPGRRYVLVDDVTTMGGTLAELAHHIQEGGGKVAGVVTLANASRLGVWVPRPQQIREIERRFGDAVREATGIEPAALTAAEAHYVLNFRDADSFRARVASAMGQRGERLRTKGVRPSEEPGPEGEGEGLATPGGGGSGPKYSLRDEPERAAIAAFERGDPETATHAMPVMGRVMQSRAGGIIGDIVRDLQIKVAPMAAGSDPARAMAKDFANAERKARWQWQRIDEILKRRFAPDRRREMGAALDEESVAAQTGQDLRGTGRGLERLTPDERAAVEMLDRYGRELWARAQAADMVRGEGLPFYMPRFLVQMTAEGARRLPEARRGVSAIEPMGRNLTTTTSNLLHRKHLTPEETEAAARQKFGDETALVTDIRALPLALGRLERAIAGRELINGIKEFGARTGQETVRAGEAPGYFTIDHPAFQRFQPRLERTENGWSIVKDQAGRPIFDRVPLYVSRNFEGPLRAVLTRPAGAIYNGLMALKGKSMSVIMYSPLIHNAVEWGRALPLMPGKVLTLRVYFEGNAFKRDPEAMGQAIVDGLVPIGARGAEADITSIAAEPTLEPGRSWTAKAAGLAARPFGEAASQHAMALVDRMGDWWHGTLLWDRVGDLQAGIYKNVRDDLIRRGTDPGSAGRIAAHLANRYAGALPREAMSDMARKIGNIVLFSRSFTLGNLGVIKDMVTGLPKDVQAQILRDGGELARAAAVSATRRAAIKAFVIDVALLYGMNAALQTALDMLLRDKTLDQVAKGYVDRFHALLQKARENPLEALNPFEDIQALSPTSANEPGKEDRVLWGYDARGTAIYLRNPVGKLGEEFKGWVTSPLDMIRRKESTIVRPLFEVLANDRGFGRQVYDPNDRSLAGIAAAAGRIAWHFLTSQIPTDTIQAAYDAVTGQGDQRANAFKVLGPMVGLTFSKGAPGGPAVGELFRLREQHAQAVAAAMPGINRAIQRGEVPQAIEAMVKLGMTPGEIRTRLRYALEPGSRLNPRALRQVQRYADPGEFQRLLDMQDEQQP